MDKPVISLKNLHLKYIIVPLLLLVFQLPFSANSQTNLDSLWTVWLDETQHDTVRVEALRLYNWEGFLFSDRDSALILAQMQLDFVKKKNLRKETMQTYGLIGIVYMELSMNEEALEYYSKSIKIAEEIGSKSGMASGFNNSGNVYAALGHYARAVNAFYSALKIYEELENYNGVAVCLSNIANIYIYQEEYESALEIYPRVIEIDEEAGNLSGIASNLANVGHVYKNLGDYERSLDYFNQAVTINEQLGRRTSLSANYTNIGVVYSELGLFEEALKYYELANEINEETGNISNISMNLTAMADVYYQQGNYLLALDILQQSLEIAQRLEYELQIRLTSEILYKVNKALGRHETALEFYEIYIQMRDELLSEENSKEIMQLGFQYEFEKREALLHAEQEKRDALSLEEIRRKNLQRNASIGGFGLMLLLAGVFFTQRNRIGKEKAISENLLLNILPAEVAEELKAKGSSDAKLIDEVTVLFTDFKGFTQLSEKCTPQQLVAEVNECFSAFDHIMDKYGIEKIKTIGDAYMAAGGLPVSNDTHALDVVNAAMEIRQFMSDYKKKKSDAGELFFEVRIGVHTGPVVAGIVGVKKFQYDIWGDTVNTASRMESNGETGQVNISNSTYLLVKDTFNCTHRGKIDAKGKGEIDMYFVEGKKGD